LNNIDPTAYAAAVEAAAHQFDYGTDAMEMIDISHALRAIDPEHPLIAALEGRIRQVFDFQFAQLRAHLTGRTMAMD
jgi:hypothetical protein